MGARPQVRVAVMLSSVHTTTKTIASAAAEHRPSSIYVAFSGGRDSAVILDIIAREVRAGTIPELKIMSIETGLQADGCK